MTGIKETSEVIDALKVLVTQGKAIYDDGKVGLDDIKKLMPAFEALKKAKEGASLIPAELKDLDGDELAELLMGLVEVGMMSYDALLMAPK